MSTPTEKFEHVQQVNRDRQKRFYEKNKMRLAEERKAKKQNSDPPALETSQFQTTHRPIHIPPVEVSQPEQPTLPSTHSDSKIFTIIV